MNTRSTTGQQQQLTGHRLQHRAAAACGALFTLGIVLGDDTINRAGEPPTPFDHGADSIAAVESYLTKAADASADGTYWVGRGIGMLAIVALLVFSVYVAREIRLREQRTGMLSGIASGSGIVAVGMGLVSCTAQFAAVARANEDIDPEIARALLDISGLTFVLMWLPIAVFMTSVSMGSRRHGLLPRWLTIATGVLAAALFAGLASLPLTGIGFLAIVLAGLWFIAASLTLVRRAA